MDMINFLTCMPGANCEGSKAAAGKAEKIEDSLPFDMVLHEEEKKLSSEAQALMLALMQKSQTVLTTPVDQENPSEGNLLPLGTTPEPLTGQELQGMMQTMDLTALASEQVDVVGTSQFVEETIQTMEVNSENKIIEGNSKINSATDLTPQFSELMTEEKPETTPVSLQELEAEQSRVDVLEPAASQRKTEAEATQRVDQVVKSVIQDEKTANQEIKAMQNDQPAKEMPNDQGVEKIEKVMDFSKVQVEQNNKSVITNEPARLAEALPRQTLTQISDQIEWMAQQGRNTLRLQLTPENLGKIDIRLVHNSQGVGVTVWTEQAETGRLLETQLNQLRDTLQNAGIQLSHLNVGQQNQGNRNGWLMENRGRSMTRNGISRLDEEPEEITQPVNVRKESGVDYRV